ncbi:MAG: MerC domain-containing protein [Candidatus Cyclonatronum sp.]|uniref:MerC domain-containing protein n=1 Tax=Cyclonatronum sp. TaxID=3024185 RepID=UPI0025BDAC7F|nr:MerC domain-containing protein [Cyclonatronum sp.]MCC5933167.1 MerC domain-containing protein [Balneolales bacterium]MCH8485555.1 MerC domain-containing protein [Cyclonatronum sp.]
MKAISQVNIFSKLSIYLSSICIIHCLAVPVLIVALPAMSFFTGSTFEMILILTVVPLSAFGFFPTWMRHKNKTYLTVYLTSVLLLLTGQFGFSHDHSASGVHMASFEHLAELVILVSGALGLAWVTYKNSKHTHSCKNPHHKH